MSGASHPPSPQGGCLLTVQLEEDDMRHAEREEGGQEVEFYLLFLGSTQRHLTSTLPVSHVKLQAVCPGRRGVTHVHGWFPVFF